MNAQTAIEPASIVSVLAQALPALGAVHKNKKNPAFKSNYADLNAVLAALAPITEYGLWFRQEAKSCDSGVALETFYIHESGAELSAGVTTVPVNKADAQGYGSAQSYCRRYALLTAFGLCADDDDGNAAAKAAPARQAQPALTPADFSKITQLIKATNSNLPKLMEAIGASPDTSLDDLSRDGFTKAVSALETKLARMAKAETDAKAETVS